MRWVHIETLNFQTFSQVRFGFAPGWGILLLAQAFGTAMGLLGGVLPGSRAARAPILEAAPAYDEQYDLGANRKQMSAKSRANAGESRAGERGRALLRISRRTLVLRHAMHLRNE